MNKIIVLIIYLNLSIFSFLNAQSPEGKKEIPSNNTINVSSEKELKTKIEIVSPKNNTKVIKNTVLSIKWKYVTEENDNTEKKDEQEEISEVKIELSNQGTIIKDAIESKLNNISSYDWYVNKESGKHKIKITDNKDGDISAEVEFEVVNAIDVFLPDKEDSYKGGGKIVVGWTVNYDENVDLDKLKLEFSNDGGNTWKIIETKDKIKVKSRTYIFQMDAPEDIGEKTCKFRITDETNKSDIKESVSDAFLGKRPSSSNYILKLGGDFDFFEGVKISDLHTTAILFLPDMTKTFGLNLYLGRSRGHGQDTSSFSGPFTDSTVKSISASKKSDVVNIALGAGLISFSSIFDPFYFMLPYLEYRRGLKEVKSNTDTVKTDGLKDITIQSEVTDKKTVDEWLIGYFGLGVNLKHKLFSFTGYAVLAYNTASFRSDPKRVGFLQRTDVILRFDLMETGAEVSFGGELRYPLVYTPNTSAELTFYLTKDISLSSLYNDLFGKSSK